MSPLVLADEWEVFCRLWPMIGSFTALQSLTPEQRDQTLPHMLILLSARCLTLELSVITLGNEIDALCDCIEHLDGKLRRRSVIP